MDIKCFPHVLKQKEVSTAYKNELNTIRNNIIKSSNVNYISNFVKQCVKAEDEYNSDEMKSHMEEMIVGLEICLLSKYLSLDLQSNITRMLYTRFNKNNVLLVGDNFKPEPNTIIKNPAHPFETK